MDKPGNGSKGSMEQMVLPIPGIQTPEIVVPSIQTEFPFSYLKVGPDPSSTLSTALSHLLTAYNKGYAEGQEFIWFMRLTKPEILNRCNMNRRTSLAALKNGDLLTAASAAGRAEAYGNAYYMCTEYA